MTSRQPWFRFYSEILSDRKLQRIGRATGQPAVTIIGAWSIILAIANDSPERGVLLLDEDRPWLAEDLADEFGLDLATTERLLQEFQDWHMLHTEGVALCVTNWQQRQFSSDSSTERVNLHRQRKVKQSTPVACNVSAPLQERDCNAPEQNRADTDQTRADTDQTRAEAEPPAAAPSAAIDTWLKATGGAINAVTVDKINDEVDTCESFRLGLPRGSPGANISGDGWVRDAILATVEAISKPRWSYTRAILDRWRTEGYKSKQKGANNGNSSRSGGVVDIQGHRPYAATAEEFYGSGPSG
jgi:hypothetical protein